VEGLYAGVLAMERALDVHQAAVVAGGADFGAGGEDGGGFFGEHGGGDVGIFDGEGSAEAAAFFERGKLDEFDAADVAEEAHGAVAEGEIAKAVAAGVVGDAVGVDGADAVEVETVGEEFGELEDAGEEVGDGGFEAGVAGLAGHFGVVVAHHGDAGGGRDDYGFGVGELGDEALEEGEGFGLVAGVVVHLAAAGLGWGEVDGVAEALEDTDDGLAGTGEERVVITGDEERDAQGAPLSGWREFNRDYISNCTLSQIRWYAIRESHSLLKQNEGAWNRIRYLA